MWHIMEDAKIISFTAKMGDVSLKLTGTHCISHQPLVGLDNPDDVSPHFFLDFFDRWNTHCIPWISWIVTAIARPITVQIIYHSKRATNDKLLFICVSKKWAQNRCRTMREFIVYIMLSVSINFLLIWAWNL